MRIISGKFRGRTLQAPKHDLTRPTSEQLRGALFNICQHWIEGAYIADFFAGSGAIGLEALSRGAAFVLFLEKDPKALASLKKNIETLHLESATRIVALDIIKWIKIPYKGPLFDLIFIDPPYAASIEGIPLAQYIAQNVIEKGLLKPDGSLFIESDTPIHLSIPSKNVRHFGDTLLSEYTIS